MKDYKRVTRKIKDGYYLMNCDNCPANGNQPHCNCAVYEIKKLGKLEDKIEDGTLVEWKYKKECLEELNKLNTQLFEISQKMEQGILIELPCKVGDTVYRVVPRCSDINSCNDFDQHICGRPYCNAYIRKEKFDINILYRIGKDYFIPKEEAEIALAQLKGE